MRGLWQYNRIQGNILSAERTQDTQDSLSDIRAAEAQAIAESFTATSGVPYRAVVIANGWQVERVGRVRPTDV
jgi:hypothetical protein